MPERIVTVRRFEQLWRTAGPPPQAAFLIECGSGTYVRSLIADLHDAYCLELRRTAIGPFTVDGASRAAAGRRLGAADTDLRRGRALARAGASIGLPIVQITPLGDAKPQPGRSVAVGTFDGVHLGHREVIAGSDSVLTFEPHPLAVIAPEHVPRLLTTLEERPSSSRSSVSKSSSSSPSTGSSHSSAPRPSSMTC